MSIHTISDGSHSTSVKEASMCVSILRCIITCNFWDTMVCACPTLVYFL